MGFSQRLIRDVFYPLVLRRAGDGAVLDHLREFERTQYLPAVELLGWQRERLRCLLDHAYRRCPFYRERFDAAGLAPGDLDGPEALRALPALEKRDVQRHRDRMVARDWPRDDLIANQTGGSTGTPVSFFLSRDRVRSRTAATVRHNRWAGWDVGDKVAFLWGAPQDAPARGRRARLRDALVKRHIFLDSGHITEAKLALFHEALKRFRPKVLHAYARAAVLFASYLKSRGLTAYQPRSVVTSAEVLGPADRALLSEVFGCPVFDRYGSREVSVLASECDAHRGLHVMAEGLFIEIVRGDRPSAPGEEGAVLATDLLNRAMPLIRYRIGDTAAFEDGPCPCGRGLPRLRGVTGRVTDFLVGADGRLVSGVFLATYVVAQRPSLGQVQIRQSEAGKVLYRIRRGHDFREAADLDYLREATRRHLGAGASSEFEFAEELEVTPSGKFLFARSTVAPDFLEPAAARGGGL
jgi:phenylacetate-CoA ligase